MGPSSTWSHRGVLSATPSRVAEETEQPAAGEEGPQARPIEDLLAALRAGIDRETNQRHLFQRYYRLVRHYFRCRGWTAEQVEDLSQEPFLRVFHSLDGFRGEARFETWLLRIANNAHCELLRRASTAKRAASETSLDQLTAGEDEAAGIEVDSEERDAEPLRRLLSKEQALTVMTALDDLPPQMGQCVLLRFSQELSYREIASILHLSVGTVKAQLHRGRRRLRQAMANRFDPFPGED